MGGRDRLRSRRARGIRPSGCGISTIPCCDAREFGSCKCRWIRRAVGPPSFGKTMLARAAAGEAGVPCFNSIGGEFAEMLVSVGASPGRDLLNDVCLFSPR